VTAWNALPSRVARGRLLRLAIHPVSTAGDCRPAGLLGDDRGLRGVGWGLEKPGDSPPMKGLVVFEVALREPTSGLELLLFVN
jgi:hypothetical protein